MCSNWYVTSLIFIEEGLCLGVTFSVLGPAYLLWSIFFIFLFATVLLCLIFVSFLTVYSLIFVSFCLIAFFSLWCEVWETKKQQSFHLKPSPIVG